MRTILIMMLAAIMVASITCTKNPVEIEQVNDIRTQAVNHIQESRGISFDDTFVIHTSIAWVSSEIVYGEYEKKDLSILYFTDDTCHWADSIQNTTFRDSIVLQLLGEFYNPCKISTMNDSLVRFFDRYVIGDSLFKGYNLVGVPSFLIVDKTGKYVGRIRGYIDRNEEFKDYTEKFIYSLLYFVEQN